MDKETLRVAKGQLCLGLGDPRRGDATRQGEIDSRDKSRFQGEEVEECRVLGSIGVKRKREKDKCDSLEVT